MLKTGLLLAQRYEIMEKVGAGGMADVYKAKDVKLGRLVAVKVLKGEFSSNETFVKKFNAEAQSAAGLSHPNIVGVYDVGCENGINYIVMELVQGITLKNYINMKGHLEIKEALNIAVQVASGLSAAHDNKVIHRDIKPQNIILSRDGKAKIADFGIAKMADSRTKSTNAAGSVHYISPEQARGGFSDARSDIYSLGITMYEMVTGKVPFEGETNVAVALSHIHDKMPSPKDRVPELPESFNKIILKCTEKKPDFRYQSAKALIADLRKALTNPGGEYVLMGAAALGGATSTVMLSDAEVKQVKAEGENTVVIPAAEKPRTQQVQRKPLTRDTAYLNTQDDDDDDDDDDEDVNPGVKRMMIFLGVIGIAVLCVIVVFILTKMTSCSGSKPQDDTAIESTEDTESEDETKEQVKVPDFGNMKYEDALNLAKQQGLEVKLEEEYSDKIDEGRIIRQSIEKNTMADKDSKITLYVSKGEDPETEAKIPDVKNYTYELAKDKLNAMGFKKLNPIYEESDDVESGKVIKTGPEIGETAKKSDTIDIYVSKGKGNVALPTIIGAERGSAVNALTNAGFKIASETAQNSDTVPNGHIISATVNGQAVTNGQEVEKGASVAIVVSSGPAAKAATLTLYDSVLGDADEGDVEIRYKGVILYSKHLDTWGKIVTPEFEYAGGSIEVYVDGEIYATFDNTYYGFTYK